MILEDAMCLYLSALVHFLKILLDHYFSCPERQIFFPFAAKLSDAGFHLAKQLTFHIR